MVCGSGEGEKRKKVMENVSKFVDLIGDYRVEEEELSEGGSEWGFKGDEKC